MQHVTNPIKLNQSLWRFETLLIFTKLLMISYNQNSNWDTLNLRHFAIEIPYNWVNLNLRYLKIEIPQIWDTSNFRYFKILITQILDMSKLRYLKIIILQN
jgi:hypothetical protein